MSDQSDFSENDERSSSRKDRRPRRRRRATRSQQVNSDTGVAADADPALKAYPEWTPASFPVPPQPGRIRFYDLNLPTELLHAIADLNFHYCTPIQEKIIPEAIKGMDALGQAQTGTGKTAAFLIAVCTRLLRAPEQFAAKLGKPRVLILAPTRELVMQIEKEARALTRYCSLSTYAIVGGIDYQRQLSALRTSVIDIMVATPGRLLDFKSKSEINLKNVSILIIDEADRMLDMGFIPDVRRIVFSTPPKTSRQTLMFSATLSRDVDRLAASWTNDPIRVEINPENVAVDTVEQIIYVTTANKKFRILYNLLQTSEITSAIVFCNRRDQTHRIYEKLRDAGISCGLISGLIDQKQRVRVLERFKNGKIRILVATDVAGRGLHIEGVSHVINYTLPYESEDYVHRIGRTGRAGASGKSISFACEADSFAIPEIEAFIGHDLVCTEPPPELLRNWKPRKKNQRGTNSRRDASG